MFLPSFVNNLYFKYINKYVKNKIFNIIEKFCIKVSSLRKNNEKFFKYKPD